MDFGQNMSQLANEGHIVSQEQDVRFSTSSVTLAIVFVLASISYGYMTLTRTARVLNKLPGTSILPFIGTIWDFIGPPVAATRIIHEARNVVGPIFRFWILHSPYVGIIGAEAAEKIFSSPVHIDKGKDYQRLKWVLGDGLVTSDVDVWKEDRKLLNPSFKYQKFDGFLFSFNKQSKILVNILKTEFETIGNPKEVHTQLCSCAMDSISEGVLGHDLASQVNPNDVFLKTAKIIIKSIQTRILMPWLIVPIFWDLFGMGRQEAWSLDTAGRVVGKAAVQRREALKKLKEVGGDDGGTKPLVDVLLETKTPQDILHHVLTIFGAGFETTSSGINFTLFLLALNPECQARAQQEIDTLFDNSDPTNEKDITFAHLADLKYLELCIKESLRLYPPVPLLGRSIHSDITLDDGLVIPAGVDVAIFINELHRDPAVFLDPECFDPLRFVPELCASRHPYAYAPFSLGPRSCIGQKYAMMQMKVILSHLLRNFSIRTELKREDIEITYGIVSQTTQPIKFILTDRKK